MEYLPMLLKHIENNDTIQKVVTDKNFSNVNFSKLEFTKEWDNQYVFTNFYIENESFSSVRIMVTSDNVSISILSEEVKYFDDPLLYFGIEGILYEKEPYRSDTQEIKEFRRKLGSFGIFNKTAKISVLKSALYGCIIKIGIYN